MSNALGMIETKGYVGAVESPVDASSPLGLGSNSLGYPAFGNQRWVLPDSKCAGTTTGAVARR